jgi:excisionase family DNA binding protein
MADLRTTTSERPAPTAVRRADVSEVTLTRDQARLVELVLKDEETVSPQDAAFLLGVSRPMVVRWIREGLLEDRKTGSHHKIPLTSVQALREQRAAAGRDAVAAVRDATVDASAERRTAAARKRAQARIARRDHTS